MNDGGLGHILQLVAAGGLSPDDALTRLRRFPIDQLNYAQVDHLRPIMQGHPEVVFCPGKTPEQVVGICRSLSETYGSFLATRSDPDVAAALSVAFPAAQVNPLGKTVYLPGEPPAEITGRGTVLVVTAGTSDLPTAEEAAVALRAMGNRVARLTDVGVAGIHRLLVQQDALEEAAVVIVAAGMDGALPSVVGGMVGVPVIAVPTSVGYGASYGGLAALLAMLNSCASGVVVVNIDNGFGAAAAASRINRAP